VCRTPLELYITAKPLPSLPRIEEELSLRRWWGRLPAKQRISLLVGIQMILVLALFGGLMSIRASPSDRSVTTRII
jgi:hypothetical protein